MQENSYQLSDGELNRIYAALASEVEANSNNRQAAHTFRSAGLLTSGDGTALMEGIDAQFLQSSQDEKLSTIRVLARKLMEIGGSGSVSRLLREHGFQYLDGSFIPIKFFDPREARFIPASSLVDISTALGRLIDGDLDGALGAACGAVESGVSDVYRGKSLGDVPRDESFQKKAMTAIEENGTLAQLKSQLVALGWDDDKACLLCKNLKGVFNQAAYVMQTLRSQMSDVHGGKPAIDSVVFDALKLASILVSFMK